MVARRPLFIVWILLQTGCAATAGSASHESLRTAELSSSRREPPSAGGAPLSGAVLDRGAYVRAVLRSNPSIESARQAFRAALARVKQAGAFEDPMVDLAVAPLSFGSSHAPIGAEIGVSQKLPWFGKRSLEVRAEAAEAEAMRSDFEAQRRELALAALSLYDEYFVVTRSLEINRAHVQLLRTLRDGAVAEFEAGRGSAQDPLQAESELAMLDRDSSMLASQREVTVAEMNELLHRPPDAPLPPPPRELELPPLPDQTDVSRLGSEAVASEPEIAAARDRARAEGAKADRAGREYYPDLTVSAAYSTMWSMPEHRFTVGVGFNLPIQTGKRAGAADEAEAARAGFESDAVRLADKARTRVFVGLRRLKESREILSLFEDRLLPLARSRIDAARAGFVASRNSFAAVIEAERALRTTELDYQMARTDYDKRHWELERALGRVPGLESGRAAR